MTQRIWLTSKARIEAEIRYNRYSRFFHLLFCYYSLLTICTSLFNDELSDRISHFNETNICVSVVLFSLSLIVYGFQFEKLASIHRSCYLKLKALDHQNFVHIQDKLNAYDTILADFPNHATIDYETFLFKAICLQGKTIKDDAGDIDFGFISKMLVIFRHLGFYLFFTLVTVLPLYFLLFPIVHSINV